MKAAVFDLDGTLVDSTEFWAKLPSSYLLSLGKDPEVDLNKKIEGLTIMETISYMKDRYEIEDPPIVIKDQLEEMIFSFYKNHARFKPFAIEIIKALKEKNIRLAIASLTEEKFIKLLLEKYAIYEDFEFIQTCGNLGLNKDDIGFFKHLSERMDLDPKDIVFFEDSLYSIETAKDWGLKLVAVEDKYAKKDLKDIIKVSDIYIKSFKNLLEFLK